MAQFFSKFPQTSYDISRSGSSNRVVLTNILTRFKIIDSVKNNTVSYFEYQIEDSDTLEIIAEKFYGSPELHWIIALTNDIIDPIYDLPLDYRTFNRYIIAKYGSLETAKTTIDHYEKIITRTDSKTGIVTIKRTRIDADTYGDLIASDTNSYLLDNGSVITEVIERTTVTIYDEENELNEAKRVIKIIQPVYVSQIKQEFVNIMNEAVGRGRVPGLRSLRG